jgi:hypothetical protein
MITPMMLRREPGTGSPRRRELALRHPHVDELREDHGATITAHDDQAGQSTGAPSTR